MKKLTAVAVMVGYLVTTNFADNESTDPKIINGWGRLTTGQVVSAQENLDPNDYRFEREWLKNFYGGIRIHGRIAPHTIGRFTGGFGLLFSARQTNKMIASTELSGKKVVPVLLDATIQSTFDLFDGRDIFQAEFGYFPFKYNPQSVNLGEYLYRSGTYPGFLISGFENSTDKPKLCGLHLSYTMKLAGLLRHDLLLTTEMDFYPLHDPNLGYIFTYTPPVPFFELGGGVEWARFIPVEKSRTTPGLDEDNFNMRVPDSRKWVGYVDTATGDTTMYTFSGTKLMARLTINPQAFYRIPFLGEEDLKIYGEAALLGVKNYDGWYENRKERVPAMFGINWPTHPLMSYCVIPGLLGYLLEQKASAKRSKAGMFGAGGIVVGIGSWLLNHFLQIDTRPDIVAIEGEWYGSKYWNTQEFAWKDCSPVPYSGSAVSPDINNWTAKTDDDWKWSVYLSKRITSFLRISGQVASDHTPRNWYTPGPPSYVKYTEMVPRSNDWYWMMRISCNF